MVRVAGAFPRQPIIRATSTRTNASRYAYHDHSASRARHGGNQGIPDELYVYCYLSLLCSFDRPLFFSTATGFCLSRITIMIHFCLLHIRVRMFAPGRASPALQRILHGLAHTCFLQKHMQAVRASAPGL